MPDRTKAGFPAGAQSLLRSMNARAVLEIVHRDGPISRAAIAEATGLSKPTVSQTMATLLSARVIEETGHVQGRKGPAAGLYEVRPTSALSAAVDIGHDKVRVAISDLAGQILASRQVPARRRFGTLVTQVRDVLDELTAELETSVKSLVHVVVGVPAVVDADNNTLTLSDSLPNDGVGFPQAIRAALKCPVTFENDVNLAVLGEREHGHGRDVDDFVFLSVGTGVGVGIVLGGQLYRGMSGAAGEIGYLPGDDPAVLPTAPRTRAMIEATLSGEAIVAEAAARGMRDASAPEVFDHARAGSAPAEQVVDVIAARIAYVIACVTAVLDPRLVVLGGGVGLNRDLLLDPVTRHVEGLSPFAPRIEVSKIGADAVLLGAVAMTSSLARETVFSAATV